MKVKICFAGSESASVRENKFIILIPRFFLTLFVFLNFAWFSSALAFLGPLFGQGFDGGKPC